MDDLIPILYNYTQANEYGKLFDAFNIYADSELNGGYELSFSYPITGALYGSLDANNIVMATNEKDGTAQPYRIYRVTKAINGIVTVYARHKIQADLAGIPIAPYSVTGINAALQHLISSAMVTNPFTFSREVAKSGNFAVTVPTPAMNVLVGQEGSIIDVYGGELYYDGDSVTVKERLGADRGVEITYGVNMTDFEQETNLQDMYTGAVGYYYTEDGDTSTLVYSPVVNASGTFNYTRIATIDLTDRWKSTPTTAQITESTQKAITRLKIGVPKVSIKLSFVDLSQTTGYTAIDQSVALGDTVHVHFEKIGVTADARVVKTRWNVLLDRYESVDIGTAKVTLADTIAGLIKKK